MKFAKLRCLNRGRRNANAYNNNLLKPLSLLANNKSIQYLYSYVLFLTVCSTFQSSRHYQSLQTASAEREQNRRNMAGFCTATTLSGEPICTCLVFLRHNQWRTQDGLIITCTAWLVTDSSAKSAPRDSSVCVHPSLALHDIIIKYKYIYQESV